MSSKKPRITRVFLDFQQKPRKPRENQESKNPRFSGRCLVHYKISDSWFSRGFLGFLVLLGNSWVSSKKPRITRFFFGFPAKNQDLLGFVWISSKQPRITRGFLDFQQKTKIY